MKELIKALGKRCYVSLGGVNVLCVIRDVKQAYGRDLYQVTPVRGNGLVWITQVDFNTTKEDK